MLKFDLKRGAKARPSVLIGALGGALLMTAPFYFAQQADKAALAREQQVVANGVATYGREVAKAAIPQTVWDDAVKNLDNRFNREWAHENVGAYFSGSMQFESAFVLNSGGRIIYAMRDGEDAGADAVRDLHDAAAPLAARVREMEARRRPLKELVAQGLNLSQPILASAVTLASGRPYILTATLVQPDFGKSMPRGAQAPIVVTAMAFNEAVARHLAENFMLSDMHFHLGLHPDEPGRASVPIGGAKELATLDWRPARPGTAMLTKTMPPLLVILVTLAALAAVLYRQNDRSLASLKASEAHATHLAYHDGLTGLPNRLLLAGRLEHALEALRSEGRGFAIYCVDLDRFKEVNDTFGHAAGDDLIRASAGVLSQICGPGDTLARLGGDEFAIVQPGATRQEAEAFAARILQAIAAPVDLPVGRVFSACTVGVALIEDDGVDAPECMRRADLALYQAKDEGRGRYSFFRDEMDNSLRHRREIRDELRLALQREELTLVYQPQVHNGVTYGVEALVRWVHARRGNISPAVFVPIAEESGLIEQLGVFTMRRAFEDSKKLGALRVAVNISAAQLRLRGFVDNVRQLARETRVDPTRIEFEITEGLLLGDSQHILDALNELRGIGFRIALDDFGTGYSSLSYLQRYPIDKIKIDRSFIANLGLEENSDAVVAAIVRLARALKLDVIAEGVETELQRVRLAQAGCGDIQGYLFGKPAPLDSVLDAITAFQPRELTARSA